MKLSRLLSMSGLLAVAAAACGAPALYEPDALWCGERLCDWTTDTGTTGRAPTWHEQDHGVRLSGDPVVLSRTFDSPNLPTNANGNLAPGPTCVKLRYIADRDSETTLAIDFDANDNGSIDASRPLPTKRWQVQETSWLLPPVYTVMKVSVRKTGKDDLVLGQLQLIELDDCSELVDTNVALTESGYPCELDSECASGFCSFGRGPQGGEIRLCAVHCGFHPGCPSGLVCGQKQYEMTNRGTTWVWGCTALGATKEFDPCSTSEQCATGLCCHWACYSGNACPSSPL